jgi:hypothetical protein
MLPRVRALLALATVLAAVGACASRPPSRSGPSGGAARAVAPAPALAPSGDPVATTPAGTQDDPCAKGNPSAEGGGSDQDDGNDLFEECKDLWRRGSPDPLRAPPKRSPGRLRVLPDVTCAGPSGWAGIGLWHSMQFWGFSADSRLFSISCALCRVDTSTRAGSLCGDGVDVDGTPFAQKPEVSERLRTLGMPAGSGRWPRDDLYVRWSVGKGGAIIYELCSDATGERVTIASFPGPLAMPLDVNVSPDGRWLAIVNTHVAGDEEVRLLRVDTLAGMLR